MDSSGSFIFAFFYLVAMILIIVSIWNIFEKAGKPGWAAIVPIYNIIILLEIINKPTWWLIMLLIPFANIVFGIMMTNGLSKSFGKDEGFTVGLIFLPFVFYPILGLGDAQYRGTAREGRDIYDHIVD